MPKSQTKSQIIEILKEDGNTRPVDLSRKLGFSTQVIHRHLKDLVSKGIIEAVGAPPKTSYKIVATPDLTAIAGWVNAKHIEKNPEEFVSERRDTLAARLPRMKNFLKHGLPLELLPLVIATTGEVGNNSFDHNLGQWRDVPGCWVEAQVTGKKLWICVADRGQGIFSSLSKTHKTIKDEQTALESAFELVISGRAPEQRGNGLKFVRNTLKNTPASGVACISGSGQVQYGDDGELCLANLKKNFRKVNGTVTLMVWALK